MFESLGDYMDFQRKEGRAWGRRMRDVIAPGWTEEKDVWSVQPTHSAEKLRIGFEHERVILMNKLGRDVSTTWTEFINGSAYTIQDILDEWSRRDSTAA